MHHQQTQKLYSCGHSRPQGPIQSLIASATPLLLPQQAELHSRTTSTSTTASRPRSSSYTIDENTVFTETFVSSSPCISTSSSASSSRRSSLTKDLTPEERVAAGVEYMAAFLASKNRAGASLSPASTRPSSLANSPSGLKAVRTLDLEESADRMLRLQMKRKKENERAMAKFVARLT